MPACRFASARPIRRRRWPGRARASRRLLRPGWDPRWQRRRLHRRRPRDQRRPERATACGARDRVRRQDERGGHGRADGRSRASSWRRGGGVRW